MAHTKAQGSVRGNRDSVAKRLGLKMGDGQVAKIGNIIVRQKGTHYFADKGVSMGKDFTLFASSVGAVKFKSLRGKRIVQVV